MKKLPIIGFVLFLALNVKAQQAEDDPSVGGRSSSFGIFKGAGAKGAKLIKGLVVITGKVVNVSWCEEDCHTMLVKTTTGNMVTVGTKDYGFGVPKDASGKKIIVEGFELAQLATAKKPGNKAFQKDIQVAATGIKIFE